MKKGKGKMARYVITKQNPNGGLCGGVLTRVIELADGDAAPEGAVKVKDDTPLTDWNPAAVHPNMWEETKKGID